MEVNFFWKGDNFSYLNRLCVLSHIKVGHKAVMWLSGHTPKSSYWIADLPEVEIRNADSIVDVTEFLETGGNFKTASSLWRFTFLYEFGGLYCDTDAMAIKKFPEDEWIISSSVPKENLSTGVIKAPPGQEVFRNCLSKLKKEWGNVVVFTDEYRKVFGNTDCSHDYKLFYPFSWRDWQELFKKKEIPDVYSVHLYHTMIENANLVMDKSDYNLETMLGKMIKRFDG